MIMGTAPPGDTYNSEDRGVPMIAGAGDYGERHPQPKKWTTAPIAIAKPGDIIICVRATIGDLNWADREYCLGRGVAAIRPKGALTTTEYLSHALEAVRPQLVARGTGSTFPAVRRGDIEDLLIPLPYAENPTRSLAEQRRIAAILDKGNDIRRNHHRAIEAASYLVPAIFYDMFGDPATNGKRWPIRKVGDLLDEDRGGTRCGPFGSALHKEDYVKDGIPVWGIDNVLPNRFVEEGSLFIPDWKYRELTSYSVEEGDILISRAGTVGRMCVARPRRSPSIIGTNLIRVRANRSVLVPDYLTTLFTFFASRLRSLRANVEEEAYSFMKTGVLREIEIPLPPLTVQEKFLDALLQLNAVAERLGQAERQANDLFNSLAQRAFKGEL